MRIQPQFSGAFMVKVPSGTQLPSDFPTPDASCRYQRSDLYVENPPPEGFDYWQLGYISDEEDPAVQQAIDQHGYRLVRHYEEGLRGFDQMSMEQTAVM